MVRIDTMESIYLDYNATTPMSQNVIKKISEALKDLWGNPSSSYAEGRKAKSAVEEARCHVASMIGASQQDIIFTSGGTESNNMVLLGLPGYYKKWSESCSKGILVPCDNDKPHVITTNVEHDAVIMPLRHLEQKGEIDLSVIPVNTNGCISVDDILCHVQRRTCLVTVMQANNETGVVMPIAEIGRALKKLNKERQTRGFIKILFHSDAAQAIGKIDVDVENLLVDYVTIVGHKFYGPRIGALYVRDPGSASYVEPLIHGGGQERGWRPGTENTAMIVGLGEAARLVCENQKLYREHMQLIRDYLETRLENVFGHNRVSFHCRNPAVERLPNTCNVSVIGKGLYGHSVLSSCKILTASVGAACHAQNKPSGILLASGVAKDLAENAIRLSVGRETLKSDIDLIVEDLKQAVHALLSAESV